MPDITMCQGVCTKSAKCYRHQRSGTQISGEYQSFFLIDDDFKKRYNYDTKQKTFNGCDDFLSTT